MIDPPAPHLDLRWWQYIGPWPLRPLPVAIFASLFFAFTAAAAAVLETELVTNVTFFSNAVSVASGGLIVWGALWLGRRWEQDHPLNLATYLLLFVVVTILGITVRTYVGQISDLLYASPLTYLTTVLRVAIPLIAINSIVGVATARLAAQVEQTQAALALTRLQQDWMLAADEQARRQVADTLHDQVQAALIAACLQLQATDPSDRSGIDAVIGRLEELRKIDVRRAARALSPTLSEVGLSSSLAELASQYEPAMVTFVTVDPRADGGNGVVDERVRLGCYRIAEQALLNAAVHGTASSCRVDVALDEGPQRVPTNGPEADGKTLGHHPTLVLTIDDDGEGFVGTPHPGSGSALISTWVRTLDGEWLWAGRPEGGVRVTVRVPASQV